MNAVALPAADAPAARFTMTLQELLEDGIYLLFLLRNGNPPNSPAEFNKRIDSFLGQFEANARNLGKSADLVTEARYAFCALLDEIVLASSFEMRSEWERSPLQLRLFGEHLAGERFFDRLETLRLNPVANLEALEVYYTCLLLGFQGKYLLEGSEKLSYLTNRVGQEIAHARGGKAEFAPHWQLPQRFQQYVRNELPLWFFFALLAVVGSGLFGAYHWLLQADSEELAFNQARPAVSAPEAPAVKPRTSI